MKRNASTHSVVSTKTPPPSYMDFLMPSFLNIGIALTFLGGLLSFSPYIHIIIVGKSDLYSGSSIEISYTSEPYKNALLISSILALPMIFDSISDLIYFQHWSRKEKLHGILRCVLIATLSVPNAILYSGVTNESAWYRPIAHACVNTLRIITAAGCVLTYMSQGGPDIGAGWKSISVLLLFVIVQLLFLYNSLNPGNSSTSAIAFLFIAVLGIVFLDLGYGFVKKRMSEDAPRLTTEEVCFGLYYTALSVVAICTLGVLIANSGTNVFSYSASGHASFIYLQMLFVVFITVLPSKVLYFDLVTTKFKMEARQAFIRYISHEIRTPLNTVFLGMTFVRTSLEQAQDENGLPSEMLLDTVEDISNSCQTALSTLNDLLTFDKIDSGQMQLEMEETHPLDYITVTSKPFSVQARQKGISFRITCEEVETGWTDKFVLNIDQYKVGQVIRNLISNAMKFTPEGGSVDIVLKCLREDGGLARKASSGGALGKSVRGINVASRSHKASVSVRPMNIPPGTGAGTGAGASMRVGAGAGMDLEAGANIRGRNIKYVARFEVKDTGAGISEENQKKLFGQYVQFNASKLQKGAGSGLGLWITKGIVELHDGKIGAWSAGEGRGTTFWVEFPLTERPLQEREASVVLRSLASQAALASDFAQDANATTTANGNTNGNTNSSVNDNERADLIGNAAVAAPLTGEPLHSRNTTMAVAGSPIAAIGAPRNAPSVIPSVIRGSDSSSLHASAHARSPNAASRSTSHGVGSQVSRRSDDINGPVIPTPTVGFAATLPHRKTQSVRGSHGPLALQVPHTPHTPQTPHTPHTPHGHGHGHGHGQGHGQGHSNRIAGVRSDDDLDDDKMAVANSSNDVKSLDERSLLRFESLASAFEAAGRTPSAALRNEASYSFSVAPGRQSFVVKTSGRFDRLGNTPVTRASMMQGVGSGDDASVVSKTSIRGIEVERTAGNAVINLSGGGGPNKKSRSNSSSVPSGVVPIDALHTPSDRSLLNKGGDNSNSANVSAKEVNRGSQRKLTDDEDVGPVSPLPLITSGVLYGTIGRQMMHKREFRAPSAILEESSVDEASVRGFSEQGVGRFALSRKGSNSECDSSAGGSVASGMHLLDNVPSASATPISASARPIAPLNTIVENDKEVDDVEASMSKSEKLRRAKAEHDGADDAPGQEPRQEGQGLGPGPPMEGLASRQQSNRSKFRAASGDSESYYDEEGNEVYNVNWRTGTQKGPSELGVVLSGAKLKPKVTRASDTRHLNVDIGKLQQKEPSKLSIGKSDDTRAAASPSTLAAATATPGPKTAGTSPPRQQLQQPPPQQQAYDGEETKTLSGNKTTGLSAGAGGRDGPIAHTSPRLAPSSPRDGTGTGTGGGGSDAVTASAGGVELPRLSSASAQRIPRVSGPKSKPTGDHKLRFLVVDDSGPTRKMTRRLLQFQGHEVEEATDGRNCVEVYKNAVSVAGAGGFNVVLMDDQMPFMSGPDATAALRELGYNGAIVGVTGNTMPEDKQRFMDRGATFVLTKPLDMADMMAKLKSSGKV